MHQLESSPYSQQLEKKMLCSSEDQGQLTINNFYFFKETNIEGKKKTLWMD